MGIRVMKDEKLTLDYIMSNIMKSYTDLAKFKLQSIEKGKGLSQRRICNAEESLIMAYDNLNEVNF